VIYVVEIAGPTGGRAEKGYDADSFRTALKLAEAELRGHPQCWITNVWGAADGFQSRGSIMATGHPAFRPGQPNGGGPASVRSSAYAGKPQHKC
jgi:hypothetical protein